MREIKFRGKRVDNAQWVHGDLLTEYIHHKGLTIVEGGCVYYEVDPATVGQFTGLKDKNGVEIFEGDIIHFRDGVADEGGAEHEIAWGGEYPAGEYPAFDLVPWLDCDSNGLSYIFAEDYEVEVVGNIHDQKPPATEARDHE